MKLGEALLLRADLQKRFQRINERLKSSAKVQEGERPAEDPKALLDELFRVSDELVSAIQRINKTNSQARLPDGMTISDALARRDMLKSQHEVYVNLSEAAVVKQDRYTKSEVKFKSTVDITQIQGRADELAKQHRELDTRIQQVNWVTDLLE